MRYLSKSEFAANAVGLRFVYVLVNAVLVMEVPPCPPVRGEAPVPATEVPPFPLVWGVGRMPISEVSLSNSTICGGLYEQDCNSLKYEELAKFAVDEHNNNHENCLEKLKFTKLVKVHTQVVTGCMYHLLVEVEDQGGQLKQYKAKIWEKGWVNFKQVVEFSPKEAPEVVS